MVDEEIAIAGYYETELERRSGKDVYEIAGEAGSGVLENTGIEKDEIDGLAVLCSFSGANEPFWSPRVNESLALSPDWLTQIDIGGASALGGVLRAAEAIKTNRAETVMVLGADAPTTQWNTEYKGYRNQFEEPYGPQGPPGLFGLFQRKLEEELGVTEEHLGKLAIAQREHAQMNPKALLTEDMEMEDYLESTMVSDPVKLLDSVMFCDGGAAVIVTSGENAETITDTPVYLSGSGEYHNHNGSDPTPDVTDSGFQKTSTEAYEESGLEPDEIDAFQPYDDFTSAVALQLADNGFTSRENLAEFIEETDFSIDGDLPLNTGGGQLSTGQPGLSSGMINLVESLRQLRGEAGERQVENIQNTLITGIGVVLMARNWHSNISAVLEV